MEIFRKGSDPPPLNFGSYATCEAHLNFGQQKGGNTKLPKTLKMAIFNITLSGKVQKSTHNPLFSSTIPKLLTHKNFPKSYGFVRDPSPPPLRKKSIPKLLLSCPEQL